MADLKQDMKVEVEEPQNFAVSNQTDPKNLQELTQYNKTCMKITFNPSATHTIQTLLQQTQDKLQTMSEQIITRIDEMGTRIDDLEKNISDLMTQAGVEGTEK